MQKSRRLIILPEHHTRSPADYAPALSRLRASGFSNIALFAEGVLTGTPSGMPSELSDTKGYGIEHPRLFALSTIFSFVYSVAEFVAFQYALARNDDSECAEFLNRLLRQFSLLNGGSIFPGRLGEEMQAELSYTMSIASDRVIAYAEIPSLLLRIVTSDGDLINSGLAARLGQVVDSSTTESDFTELQTLYAELKAFAANAGSDLGQLDSIVATINRPTVLAMFRAPGLISDALLFFEATGSTFPVLSTLRDMHAAMVIAQTDFDAGVLVIGKFHLNGALPELLSRPGIELEIPNP